MDTLSSIDRSALMAKVRGRGNASTEKIVARLLRKHGITGWRRHPRRVLGCPDFYFVREKVAVFVDGCFWHACPRCGRKPKSRRVFWNAKIDANRRRDNRVRRKLRAIGIRVVRLWEHDLSTPTWTRRIVEVLRPKAHR